jgi:Protein of unknown function (DUF3106)
VRQTWFKVIFCGVSVLLAMGLNTAVAQPTPSDDSPVNSRVIPEQTPQWRDLLPAQQLALKPLSQEWWSLSSAQKQKWLALSVKFSNMTPTEQTRVQNRMSEWARLTPQERTQARLNFQEAKQLPTQNRQARWAAYQALPAEQKQQLAARAASTPAAKKMAPSQAKTNITPNSQLDSSPRAVTPTVVQARPGATTTLITKRPMPPAHQQTGLPKIAATPEFVNKSTLLPKRGPQGAVVAAAASATASAPAAR